MSDRWYYETSGVFAPRTHV
ncbi:hypothetical protein D049_4297A, partial [Vibrio parahaemolyticus VPTS-2010]